MRAFLIGVSDIGSGDWTGCHGEGTYGLGKTGVLNYQLCGAMTLDAPSESSSKEHLRSLRLDDQPVGGDIPGAINALTNIPTG